MNAVAFSMHSNNGCKQHRLSFLRAMVQCFFGASKCNIQCSVPKYLLCQTVLQTALVLQTGSKKVIHFSELKRNWCVLNPNTYKIFFFSLTPWFPEINHLTCDRLPARFFCVASKCLKCHLTGMTTNCVNAHDCKGLNAYNTHIQFLTHFYFSLMYNSQPLRV